MSRSLPPNPSFRFLQKEAKDLLRSQQAGEAAACATLRLLHRFKDQSDQTILVADVALNEVQFALAMDYGFANWADLKAHLEESAMPQARDYSQLDFRGHCMRVDSFSLAVQAAAKMLGRQVDYETVFMLSSNASCLAINLGEECPAWWHMARRETCMDLIGKAVGLEFRRLDLPGVGVRPNMPEAEMAQATRQTREMHGPILRRQWADGAILLTEGGWKVTGGPYGLTLWLVKPKPKAGIPDALKPSDTKRYNPSRISLAIA